MKAFIQSGNVLLRRDAIICVHWKKPFLQIWLRGHEKALAIACRNSDAEDVVQDFFADLKLEEYV